MEKKLKERQVMAWINDDGEKVERAVFEKKGSQIKKIYDSEDNK